ncbi:MAG: hypothetical protein H0V90_04660 [Blastocatellia bacterium]|nr:hypothetical protein [Blastocatellia bacterium]
MKIRWAAYGGIRRRDPKQEFGFPDGVIANELESFEYENTQTGCGIRRLRGMHDDTVTVSHWP